MKQFKKFSALITALAICSTMSMTFITGTAAEETDALDWVPASYQEVREYAPISIHDGYIVLNGAGLCDIAAEWILSTEGSTATYTEVYSAYFQDKPVYPDTPGGVGCNEFYVLKPEDDGILCITWEYVTHGQPSMDKLYQMEFVVQNGVIMENPASAEEPVDSIPDDYTQRIYVRDYDTKRLIHEDDQEYSISFRTGYDVEYVLTDGTFAWGTMWGETSEWDYNAQNPYSIDTSSHAGGFGVSDYEVVDIDLPDGYFLPDDYLETIEYDNGSVEIYIKLKKMLPGDVNDDGEFSVLDVILFQKWLLNVPDVHLDNWKAADFNQDDKLNIFDLLLMKKALVEVKPSESQPMLVSIYENFSWDQFQNVEVFDQYGNLYTTDTVFGRENFCDMTSDTWYEELCEMIQTTSGRSALSSELTEEVSQYIQHIDQHQNCQMSEGKGISDDFGQYKLYVIWQDSEGNADHQLLSNFGDYSFWQECEDAQRIVMDMTDSGNYAYPNYYELLS